MHAPPSETAATTGSGACSLPRVRPSEYASFAHIQFPCAPTFNRYTRAARRDRREILRDNGKCQRRRFPLAARSACRSAFFAHVQLSRAPALSRRTHAATAGSARSGAFPSPRVRTVETRSLHAFNSHARLLSADAHMPPAETVTALRRQRFPFHRKRSAPRLLSSRLVQPARRAAALAGFAQGRGKLSAHAAHRVDHLVRGHDQSHARNCGVRGAWR